MAEMGECTLCPSYVLRCAHFGGDCVRMVRIKDQRRLDDFQAGEGRMKTRPNTVHPADDVQADFDARCAAMIEEGLIDAQS